jgi:hypothetical protein
MTRPSAKRVRAARDARDVARRRRRRRRRRRTGETLILERARGLQARETGADDDDVHGRHGF